MLRLLALAALATSAFEVGAQQDALTVVPGAVEPGSAVLIHVMASSQATVDGNWLGQKLGFFPGSAGAGWYALAGADVEAPTGPSRIEIHVRTAGGSQNLSKDINIQPAHYRTAGLTVAPGFVQPGAEALKQIESDKALKEAIFSSITGEPLWKGSFHAPVMAPATDSFGTRRTFNGKLASIHKGMDFKAATGTVVRAGNAGRVVLARQLYYEGNCVIVDHGLGLWTVAMHLSRIDVKEGEEVARDQRLGLSGATGRVTGPHLHWTVRWQAASLDPAKLLKLDLDKVRSSGR